ncbi:MAG: ATP-binding protein, partial [Thermomicrobiales bacterium]
EIRVENTGPEQIAYPGLSVGEARLRVRRLGLRGSGVILGTVGDTASQTSAPFDDAGITPATSDLVADFLATRKGKGLTVGSIALSDGTLAAALDPAGFNRHTFLCGQSGSGKTYSLGVILERLLLDTDLRMVILDPNADYVHLNELRDPTAADNDPDAARYVERVSDLVVYRGRAGDEDENPLRIRFSELPDDDQARTLQLDPLADRDEFHTFRTIARSLGDRPYDLQDIRHAASENLGESTRDVSLRIANLEVEDWSVWARSDESSLTDLLTIPWRSVVLDVSRFGRPIERSVVALAMLRYFWNHREQRKPVLMVIDEAHNICPATPRDAIQQAATDLLVTIAGEGRKYGLYLLLATQRPDKIHPNVLSQCDNLMVMRMNSRADIEQLAEVFSFVSPGMLARASLFKQGEALFAGKIVPAPLFLRVGARLTTEGGADVPTTWATPDENAAPIPPA